MTFKKLLTRHSCLFLMAFLVLSCKNSPAVENQQNTAKPSAADLSARFLEKETFATDMKKSDAVIVDVRMPGEFDQGHIEGAVNINFFDPEFKYKLLELNKKKKYYLYCKNETRSEMSMKFMLDNNFKDVYVLKNGFEEWRTTKTE